MGAARLPRLRAQRDRAGDVSRCGQPRDGRCAARLERAGARRRHRDARVHRRAVPRARCRRRARRAVQLRQAPGGRHAARGAGRDRRAHPAARLAHRHLFRGAGSAGAVRVRRVAADDRGRRPHGPARRDAAADGAGLRAVREADAQPREHLVEGQRRRASVAHRRRRATTTSCRSRAASSKRSRTACCGAPTGRTRT